MLMDLCGGISDFKEGYQPRSNIVKDEKGDLDADSHNICARWGNYFSHLLNLHGLMLLGKKNYTQQKR